LITENYFDLSDFKLLLFGVDHLIHFLLSISFGIFFVARALDCSRN